MKKVKQSFRMPAIFLAGTSLFACAPFFGDQPSWQPAPGTRIVQADLRPSAGYYENAVAAINARRYALALDYLQAARTQKPDDVRVLTAFGVIYDKLGRFDLSTRYYAQAAALDPRSMIIAQDVDYSRRLQNLISPQSTPMVAEAVPSAPMGGTWPRSVDTPQPVIAAAPVKSSSAGGMIPVADRALPAAGSNAQSESVQQPVIAAVPVKSSSASGISPAANRVLPATGFQARSESVQQPVIAAVPVKSSSASGMSPAANRVLPAVGFHARSESVQQPVIVAVPTKSSSAGRMIPVADRVLPAVNFRARSESVQQPVIAAIPAKPSSAAGMSPATNRVLPAAGFHARSESVQQPVIAAVPVKPSSASGMSPAANRVLPAVNFRARSEIVQQPVIAVVPVKASSSGGMNPATDRALPAAGSHARSESVQQPVIAAVPVKSSSAGGMNPAANRVFPAAGFNAQPKGVVSVVSAGRGVFLTGHPLMLINGSGRSDAVDLVGRHLSGLGWSVAKSAEVRKAAEPQTTIFYEQSMITIAKALAHTLALPTRLTASGDIKGLQLILGSDITNFKSKGMPPGSQRKQVALAANSKSRE